MKNKQQIGYGRSERTNSLARNQSIGAKTLLPSDSGYRAAELIVFFPYRSGERELVKENEKSEV